MATVKFTSALKRFFPHLNTINIQKGTIMEVIDELEKKYPGLTNYLLDDQKVLRKHVNIFLDGAILQNRKELGQKIDATTEIYFIQALSGG